jgi:ankyrin repeat protein
LLDAIRVPGRLDVINELIAAGADVNATDNLGDNAVMEAAYDHELEIFKFFISRGVDACAQDHEHNTALFYADLNGNEDPGRAEIIAYLKEHCGR